ncbi:phosphoribosylamine--glycine ligase [Veillonella sp. VA137]|uniref:phosphoribosylamine--glycine ligase n=1 Tax=Veillonella sp. VA137 TaxID=741828 RepID=UPI000F8CC4C9|nr:phosphoribosylamine--glycine ligase [Veillonella sp. VA137]
MKVCIIGNGGREHALAWKLNHSPSVTDVYVVPGNAGMTSIATVVNLDWKNRDILLAWLLDYKIDLVVIGPELPLVEGLSDAIRAEGIPVFGPSQQASRLEGSKSFAKDVMRRYKIPTAKYEVCQDVETGNSIIRQWGVPIVLKRDGLWGGKGVTICETFTEAEQVLEEMLSSSEESVVIEEYMQGQELSFLSFVDGTHVLPMIGARDHKRLLDYDEGPNTGGMGAYAPVPELDIKLEQNIVDTIVKPIVKAMAEEGNPYVGCLYTGLMLTEEGPKVVEFNARFGDPETQVILPLLQSDLGVIMYATATGQLEGISLEWSKQYASCVILASKGYPQQNLTGQRITGDIHTMDTVSMVFHSGTTYEADHYVTQGGRVLGVVGLGNTLEQSLEHAYERVSMIDFEGQQYRKDIGESSVGFCIHAQYRKKSIDKEYN